MFSLSFEEIREDEKINASNKKVVLKAITPKGFIIIEKIKNSIVATDSDGINVCKTYSLSESGLTWVKRNCAGWGGWQKRMKWNLIEL